MHAVAARGDDIVVCFYLMSLRLRGVVPSRSTKSPFATRHSLYAPFRICAGVAVCGACRVVCRGCALSCGCGGVRRTPEFRSGIRVGDTESQTVVSDVLLRAAAAVRALALICVPRASSGIRSHGAQPSASGR